MPEDLLPKRPQYEGEKIKVEDLINKEIVILDWFIAPSTFGESKEFAGINATLGGKKIIVMTGSGVLVGVLKGRAPDGKPLYEHRPFKTTIEKIKGDKGMFYYNFAYAHPIEEDKPKEKELFEGEEKKDQEEIPF